MLNLLRVRQRQGHKTTAFPKALPQLPARFRGRPLIDSSKCPNGCTECVDSCPTDAIQITVGKPQFDLGKCTFCLECTEACPENAIAFTPKFAMATSTRDDLIIGDEGLRLAEALDKKTRALFGRSLAFRQVSAGGCNGCEAEVNALSNVVFDLSRFGISMVASPRHADGLLITGPVTQNMRQALETTYNAIPDPKLVVAVGGCAISGGPFRNMPATNNGAESVVPVDLYVPGCPPHPLTILDGLLRLLDRIESGERQAG
ncbi:MAG: NADH-quinone oxidoreductase subunit NuoB [Chloroflexi bacterium]|nr:NADH-quinone oxidoreductase subunit NuoB [Chloroflexota bacterium]